MPNAHTPGPWRVGLTVNKGDVWRGWRETDINGPEGCFLTLSQYHTADESDANARLIAQAPRMLEALARLTIAADHGEPAGDIIDEARAILRAVKGE